MKFLIAKSTKEIETGELADPSAGLVELFGPGSDKLTRTEKIESWWTDETCSTRYGIGTIEIGGVDHGPADLVPHDTLGRTVAAWLCDSYSWVDRYGRAGSYSKEEIEILRRFCSQWPDGPQFTPEKW